MIIDGIEVMKRSLRKRTMKAYLSVMLESPSKMGWIRQMKHASNNQFTSSKFRT